MQASSLQYNSGICCSWSNIKGQVGPPRVLASPKVQNQPNLCWVVFTPCAVGSASFSFFDHLFWPSPAKLEQVLHALAWGKIIYLFQSSLIKFQFTHACEIYNCQRDQKREMQVRINESQNIVCCQTMMMLMTVRITMNVKTELSESKLGPNQHLYYCF